jgi:hypothetical protein
MRQDVTDYFSDKKKVNNNVRGAEDRSLQEQQTADAPEKQQNCRCERERCCSS